MSASNHSSIKNKTLKRVPVKLVSDPDEDDSQHQGGHLWSEGTHRLLGMQVSCPKTVGRGNFYSGFCFVCLFSVYSTLSVVDKCHHNSKISCYPSGRNSRKLLLRQPSFRMSFVLISRPNNITQKNTPLTNIISLCHPGSIFVDFSPFLGGGWILYYVRVVKKKFLVWA